MVTSAVVALVKEAAELGLPVALTRPEAAALAEAIARLEAAGGGRGGEGSPGGAGVVRPRTPG